MSDKPTDVTVLQPIIPEISSPDDVAQFSNNFQQFANLTPKQLSILVAIGSDLVSETPRTDTQIAKELGVNRTTVVMARQNPQWAAALGVLVVGIARGRSDLYLQWTETAAKTGKVAALKLLWEISGLYIQRSKSMNMNIDMDFRASEQPTSYLEVIDEFIIALGEAGWSGQQIVERYNELRASGAW